MGKAKIFAYLPAFMVIALFVVVAFESTEARPEDEAAYIGMDAQLQEEVLEGTEIGNMAPDFTLETLGGDEIRLSDFQGQRVVLNFWASWCGPCREEMPDIQRLSENKDVTVLAVNLTYSEDSTERVSDFVDQYGLTFPILMDENASVSQLYRIQPIPTTYMLDSNGKIQYKAFGAMDYEWLVQELQKIK
ncbi:TlpA family protein disulfide reductase [Virgibacillus kimchii]